MASNEPPYRQQRGGLPNSANTNGPLSYPSTSSSYSRAGPHLPQPRAAFNGNGSGSGVPRPGTANSGRSFPCSSPSHGGSSSEAMSLCIPPGSIPRAGPSREQLSLLGASGGLTLGPGEITPGGSSSVPSRSMLQQLNSLCPTENVRRGTGGVVNEDEAHRLAPFMVRPQLQENLCDGSARFKLVRYACEMLDALQTLRQEGSLFDVTLRATGHCGDVSDCSMGPPVQAHKVILAGCSLYFRGMFTRGMREASQSEVLIREPSVTSDALRMFVDFAYTGEVLITRGNAQELLVAALFLEVRHLIEACTLFLENQQEPGNCVGVAAFARAHGCVDLEAKARRYIYEHFCEVAQHDEILELPAEDMAEIVQQCDLNINCESEVFDAVVRWAEYAPEHRIDQLESLLAKGVRLSSLPPVYLEEQLQRCHLIIQQPRCQSLLLNRLRRLKQHSRLPTLSSSKGASGCRKSSLSSDGSVGSMEDGEEALAILEPPPRRPGGQRVIYTAGGFYRKVFDSLRSFECYNPSTKEWTRLPDLPRPRCGPGVTALQGRVWVVGGRVMQCGGTHTDTCSLDVYDPRSNQWSTRCHMRRARSRVAVCVLDGMIYAVGGSAFAEMHRSAERYDPNTDEWRDVSSMNEARISHGVAVLNRLIYAVGGFDGTNRLASVECYHPERDVWEAASPLRQARSGAGVTVLKGHIYAVGGFDGSRQLTSVEHYDPDKGVWEEVAPLLKARSGVGVAVIEDRLYALGGFDGSDFLSCVESYNPDTDSWQPETLMLCERSGHGVAVERMPTLS